MKTRKFMLCQYPGNGFGDKNNQFYLMNQFGTKFDIVNEYDCDLQQMSKVVRIDYDSYDDFYADTLDDLIKAVEERYDTMIKRW